MAGGVAAALGAERRELLSVLAISGAIGALVGLAVTGGTTRGLLQGTLSGLLVSVLVRLRAAGTHRFGVGRWPFGAYVAANALATVTAICIGLAVASLPWLVLEGRGDLRTYAIPFAFAVLASIGFSVWFALDRLLGTDVLVGLLTGRYHQPRREERIFLFADLEGSTGLAARLGELRYHTFLNRAFGEFGDPVQRYAGGIYQYAGDEIVVTWPLERGARDANCLRCARAILTALEQSAPAYLSEFGAAPRFRMALHCGPVVAAEIGDLRREIVFSGDAINTAARIEYFAKQSGHTLVVSAELLARVRPPDDVSAESLGMQRLRGKDGALELFTLRDTSAAAS